MYDKYHGCDTENNYLLDECYIGLYVNTYKNK